MKKTLKWWLFTNLTLIAAFFLYKYGIWQEAFKVDTSYICIVITSLYCVVSLFCGYYTYEQDRFGKCKSAEPLWFCAEQMMTLGYLGTLIGFIMALGSFAAIDVGNHTAMQGLLSHLGQSLGVAIWTSIFGVVAAVLAKIQLFHLEHDNEV